MPENENEPKVSTLVSRRQERASVDTISRIIKALERKHGHGANSPEHAGGARPGAGASGGGRTPQATLARSLAPLLADPGDGASVFARGKSPPPTGYHILAAGNRKNAEKAGKVYDSHGLWTNDDGKQFEEPSFYVHTDGDTQSVLRSAETLRRANKQEAVGVVYHGRGVPKGFTPARAYRLISPGGTVELIDPEPHKRHAVAAALKKQFGKVQSSLATVSVKWMSGDDQVDKNYSTQAQADARTARQKHPAKPRKDSGVGLSDYYMKKMLDKMVDDLSSDGLDGIFKALEGDLVWEREVKAMCKAYDRDGEVVVECGDAA